MFVCFSFRNTPDPIQETQGDGYSKYLIQALSAVCVRSPHYGTRSVSSTHTSPVVTDTAVPDSELCVINPPQQ